MSRAMAGGEAWAVGKAKPMVLTGAADLSNPASGELLGKLRVVYSR